MTARLMASLKDLKRKSDGLPPARPMSRVAKAKARLAAPPASTAVNPALTRLRGGVDDPASVAALGYSGAAELEAVRKDAAEAQISRARPPEVHIHVEQQPGHAAALETLLDALTVESAACKGCGASTAGTTAEVDAWCEDHECPEEKA